MTDPHHEDLEKATPGADETAPVAKPEETTGDADAQPDPHKPLAAEGAVAREDEDQAEATGEPAKAEPVTTPSEEEQKSENADGEEVRMSFLDHLMELRKRLLSAVIAMVLTTILAFVFFEPIFAFLRAPIQRVNQEYRNDEDKQKMVMEIGLDPTKEDIIPLVSTRPLGLIVILMKVAVCAGLLLSSPIVVYEIWAFLAPGLRLKERRAIRPVLMGGLLFFAAGAGFCYYAVFPITLDFLVWLDLRMLVKPYYTVYDYLSMLITFMLIFGLVFEMPLVASVLAMLGILSPAMLTRFWRHVILVCFVMGAVLSPGGEPMSMIMMSGSMVFLYLLSIVLTKMLYRGEN